jgi:hypothetical protein
MPMKLFWEISDVWEGRTNHIVTVGSGLVLHRIVHWPEDAIQTL